MKVTLIIEWSPEDNAWITRVPELNNLSDFGSTRDEAVTNTIAAAKLYIEAARDKEIPVPSPVERIEVRQIEISA